MMSADGRWVISYNGEVYNAEAIAAAPTLAGLKRRGTSDTEVIVESVARRGLDVTLAELNGMFAIALWDRANPHTAPGSRSSRHQAAFLHPIQRRFLLCIRTEKLCVCGPHFRSRYRFNRKLSAFRLCAGAIFDLPRR